MRLPADRRSAARNAIKIAARGSALIRNPALNKGTGFPIEERQTLGLEGLLPVRAKNQSQQAERIYQQLSSAPDDLQKYVMLNALLNRNVHLLLSRARRPPRRADADRLHADGRRGACRSSVMYSRAAAAFGSRRT